MPSILSGANVNWMDRNNEGVSALMIATCKGQREAFNLLIEAGSNPKATDR